MMLLETMLGFGLFSLALLFVFSLFPVAQQSSTQARDLSLATGLARDLLEEKRALTFDDPGLVSSSPVLIPVDAEVNGVRTTLVFERRLEVTPLPTPRQDLKSVVVYVDWKYQEIPRSVQLETFVARL